MKRVFRLADTFQIVALGANATHGGALWQARTVPVMMLQTRSLLFIASVFLFLRAGKFFDGRNEALKINQPDATTSAATFQTVRFDLAGFTKQINLGARQASERAKCAGLRKPHEAWLQLRYARRCLVLFNAIATVPRARADRPHDAHKTFPFTIHTPEILC